MDVLVLGGTKFVGRHIVSELIAAGHTVALFSRGMTNADLFPEAEHLIGNRDGDLSAIEARIARRKFDACVDVSGYTLRQVERSLAILSASVDRYLFISTISVYRVPVSPGFTEDSPVEALDDPYVEMSGEAYGGLKAACEHEVRERLGNRATTFRLGLVNGPHDPTDRATYWSVRAARGGTVFVPAAPQSAFQVVDARDVADNVVRALERATVGTFNMVNSPTTWAQWLGDSMAAARETGAAEFVYVDDQSWVEERLAGLPEDRRGSALPMYLPAEYGWEFWSASNARARSAGFTFRPYAETIRATMEWRAGVDAPLAVGLTPAEEHMLLEAWRTRS